MKYYLKLDDETRGPFSLEQIRQRISERAYQASDLVRLEDKDEWTTLGSLKEFAESLAPLAPLSNPMAVASLLFGVLSALLFFPALVSDEPCLFLIYWFLGIVAILCGHGALRKINRSPHDIKGYHMAKASLWLGYLVVLIIPVITSITQPCIIRFSERGAQVQAINNCKQIIISMRLYSSDSRDIYPDFDASHARSSNDVFRLLFKEGIIETEKIFGAAKSPYHPDGNIGEAPDYLEAVKPGENHWAMTKGLTGSMVGSIPLVFENPSDASWPPKWNASEANWRQKLNGKLTGIKPSRPSSPGYAWSKGKIIIGLNDSSVELYPLESVNGENLGLKPYPDGKSIFPDLDPQLEILNVAK